MSWNLKEYEQIDLKYNLKTLWSFIRRYKHFFFGLIIVSLFVEFTDFFDNLLFKYLVDQATLFSKNQLTAVLFAKIVLLSVLIFLGVKLLGAIFWFIKIRLINLLDGKVMSDLEKSAFWHIINLSYRYHTNKRTGSIISQFTRGVNKVESFMDIFAFNVIPVVFRLILSVSVIFYFDAVTALILLAMSVLMIVFGVYLTDLQKIPQNIANYREDLLKQNLSDVFLNIDTVKYFAKEKKTQDYFSILSNKLRAARVYFWNYFCWHAGIQTFIIGIGIAAIFYFSFSSFLAGKITLGSITLIYAAVWKLLPQLFGLIHGYRDFVRSSVDVNALFQMFKEKNEVADVKNAKKLQVKEGAIEFRNVSFSYPQDKNSQRGDTTTVVRNLNLEIKPHTKVALVGPSGGGKTTIVKLLYRLFDIDEGQILIDGQDIRQITQNSLRDSMSIVTQEPILFDNTLFFNIAYANPQAGEKQVWQAIRFAQLDRFIRNLPLKGRTIVGERGVKLSGGEKQRVSIARAILANKKILILDEATSSLDSGTEKEIQRDLEELMKGRTSIIIAHRLSTIMKADVIVVLDKGRIVEVGSHKELKNKRGGLYQKLWSLQQGGDL